MSHLQRVANLSAEIHKDKSHRQRQQLLSLAGLCHVTEMDFKSRFVCAEADVQMADLALTTLPFAHLPLVLPACNGLTVQEAVLKNAVGPTSHRHGCFSDTVQLYEVLTATGNVERRDTPPNPGESLLWARLAIAPLSGEYLHLHREPVADLDALIATLLPPAAPETFFLDAVVFEKGRLEIHIGTLHPQPGNGRVPLMEALFHHDLDGFLGTGRLRLWDRLLLRLLRTLPRRFPQQVALPPWGLQGFLAFYDRMSGEYPLRIVPCNGEFHCLLRTPLEEDGILSEKPWVLS